MPGLKVKGHGPDQVSEEDLEKNAFMERESTDRATGIRLKV